MEHHTKNESVEEKPTNSLLDFAGAPADSNPNVAQTPAIDELGDIFSAKDGPSNIAEPLKPVNLMSNGKDNGEYLKISIYCNCKEQARYHNHIKTYANFNLSFKVT